MLRAIAPVSGGYLETFFDARHWDAHVVPLLAPQGLIDTIITTRPQFANNLAQAALVAAPVATVVLDRVLGRRAWSELEAYEAIFGFGFGHPSALKLASFGGTGCRRTTYVSLLGDPDAPMLGLDEVAAIESLAPVLRATLERLAMPLLQRDRILEQVVAEQGLGAVVVAQSGEVREINARARILLGTYAEALGLRGRWALREAADRICACPVTADSGRRVVADVARSSFLEVTEHHLDARVYDLPEPMVLLLIVEREATPMVALCSDAMGALSPREREVATLLVTTGKSYAEIAKHLRVGAGTVRTHVTRIYQRLDVCSRAALVEKLRTPCM